MQLYSMRAAAGKGKCCEVWWLQMFDTSWKWKVTRYRDTDWKNYYLDCKTSISDRKPLLLPGSRLKNLASMTWTSKWASIKRNDLVSKYSKECRDVMLWDVFCREDGRNSFSVRIRDLNNKKTTVCTYWHVWTNAYRVNWWKLNISFHDIYS